MNYKAELARIEAMVLRQNRALVEMQAVEARLAAMEQAILHMDGVLRRAGLDDGGFGLSLLPQPESARPNSPAAPPVTLRP